MSAAGAISVAAVGTISIAAVAYIGWIDVAADSPYTPLMFETIAWAQERAIARQLDGITGASGFVAVGWLQS